jgi:hypothetical protein
MMLGIVPWKNYGGSKESQGRWLKFGLPLIGLFEIIGINDVSYCHGAAKISSLKKKTRKQYDSRPKRSYTLDVPVLSQHISYTY